MNKIEMVPTIVLLFLIIDPLGNLPIFMSILKCFSKKKQFYIIFREMIIAFFLMLIFLFSGEYILSFLNLRTETVSISGGIILFLISIKMIFPNKGDKDINTEKKEEPFLVPLAIPLIAGPSILATLMMLSHKYPHQTNYLILALFISWIFSLVILMLSNVFLQLIGSKGLIALERLMGLLLIMISNQMLLDGIHHYFICNR